MERKVGFYWIKVTSDNPNNGMMGWSPAEWEPGEEGGGQWNIINSDCGLIDPPSGPSDCYTIEVGPEIVKPEELK